MVAQLQEVQLEELLTEDLRNKQYQCSADDSHTIVAAGTQNGELLIARRSIEKPISYSTRIKDQVHIDEDGHPYFILHYKGQELREYNRFFQGSQGCGTAEIHERFIEKAASELRRTKHPVLAQYEAYMAQLIRKIPEIKEAIIRASYKGTLEDVFRSFSHIELAGMGLVAIIPEYQNMLTFPQYLPRENIGQIFRQEINIDQKELLILWYREFLQNGYKAKIEQFKQELDTAFDSQARSIEAKLKSKGFRKVEEIEGL